MGAKPLLQPFALLSFNRLSMILLLEFIAGSFNEVFSAIAAVMPAMP
jgi:hypothetical protein